MATFTLIILAIIGLAMFAFIFLHFMAVISFGIVTDTDNLNEQFKQAYKKDNCHPTFYEDAIIIDDVIIIHNIYDLSNIMFFHYYINEVGFVPTWSELHRTLEMIRTDLHTNIKYTHTDYTKKK